MDTKGGKWWGGGGGVMNWEIGIDIYILICIKWITNKNLLYKNINKIKFKKQNKTKQKTTVRYLLSPVRMATVKTSTNNKSWRGCGEN